MYTSLRLRLTLVLLAAVAVVLYGGVWLLSRAGAPDLQKRQAAQLVFDAERAIEEHRPLPTSSDSTDPLVARLLGPAASPITTDSASLTSKVTATNPNFAAAIVDMLRDAGVGSGDVVAVAYTGSFPMLDMASVIAIETLDAEPLIVSSVGASNWGATDPSFTILDIESLLFDQGLIRHRSLAASVGGSIRRGPMNDAGRDLALAAMTRNGVSQIEQSKLSSSVAERLSIYDEHAAGRPIKAFVNVGGGQASIGGNSHRGQFAPGLEVPTPSSQPLGRGLIAGMHEAGIPVIHLDDVQTLAHQYQLPIAPSRVPPVGEGGPYRDGFQLRLAAGVAAVILAAAFVGARLLVLAPASEARFDPYFGTQPARLRQRLISILRPARST